MSNRFHPAYEHLLKLRSEHIIRNDEFIAMAEQLGHREHEDAELLVEYRLDREASKPDAFAEAHPDNEFEQRPWTEEDQNRVYPTLDAPPVFNPIPIGDMFDHNQRRYGPELKLDATPEDWMNWYRALPGNYGEALSHLNADGGYVQP
jgi:hypothetical protein